MNNREKFEQDLAALMLQLTVGVEKDVENKLNVLKDWLVNLHRENVVKINHSVMELVCTTKGYGNLIVEIETGFIPPEYALCPLTYTSARLASKIIRYSSFAGKFALGMPPHYVLPFPRALAKPPRRRTAEEIEAIKKLCDKFYQNPPVTDEEICNARIQEIYIIDVDQAKVQEIDPEAYMKRTFNKDLFSDYTVS
jgi:hypothetical protein